MIRSLAGFKYVAWEMFILASGLPTEYTERNAGQPTDFKAMNFNRRKFLALTATTAAGAPFLRLFGAQPGGEGALATHKVSSLESAKVPLQWPRMVGRNAKLDVHGRGPTITVAILKTDQGAMGWGELAGPLESLPKLKEAMTGKTVAELFSPASGILEPSLKTIDFALHDLAGVILGQPVWKMIGGKQEPQLVPLYSGMIYFDDLTPVENPPGIGQVLKNCAADHAMGYRQLKAKIGRGNRWMPPEDGLKRDIEVTREIAKAFPDCEILVDGNDGYNNPLTFIEYLKGIEGIPLFWIEEPFIEDEAKWRKVYDWTRANGRGKTLLADGEQNNDVPLLEKLEAAGVLQVRLHDIAGHGFTNWRALMPQLKAKGIQGSPHCWGSGLKTVYTAHLTAALGNTPTIEGVTCSREHVDFGQNVLRDGKHQVSNAPGFGLKLIKV